VLRRICGTEGRRKQNLTQRGAKIRVSELSKK
jgi:hypothetical protein